MRALITSVLLSFAIVVSVNAKELTFGEPVNAKETMKISKLLASPQDYLDKKVTVAGTIVGVCQKRGCWMNLASDARFEKLRIKVRDGDMVFPMSAKGRQALATGYLKEIKLSLEQTQRYKAALAKRAGENFDLASVNSGMSIYQVSPIGVKILD
ncbi:MAG: DUF4920 domain-containing protein [Psychrobium sp.]